MLTRRGFAACFQTPRDGESSEALAVLIGVYVVEKGKPLTTPA